MSKDNVVSAWNDVKVDILKSMWAEGKPAREIAAHLGFPTTDSVISKAHRLHLGPHPRGPAWHGHGKNSVSVSKEADRSNARLPKTKTPSMPLIPIRST
jgi:GcrA cell cycle regulator